MLAHFARLSACTKTQSVTLTHFFVAQTVTISKQRIALESDFFKRYFTHSKYPDQTPSDSDYAGLVVVTVFKISSKYVGITHSHATRRTLGVPKLLKCINKAQLEPEPCYKKTQLRSSVTKNTALEPCLRRELRSHFVFTRAPQPWFY